MDNLNLISNFAEFKELKNIDKSTMIGVLEDVFRHALQKQYETDENFDVIINPEKGDLEIWRNRTVVEDDAVEAQFDRDEEDFSLTVMSAGIGSELKSLRQYRKLAGKSAEVLLTSGVKILAKLEEVTDEGITLSYEEKQAVEGKKKKQLVKVTRSYPFDQIKYTKEWLDFK